MTSWSLQNSATGLHVLCAQCESGCERTLCITSFNPHNNLLNSLSELSLSDLSNITWTFTMGLHIDSMFSRSKADVLKHDTLLSSSITERCFPHSLDRPLFPTPAKQGNITELVDLNQRNLLKHGVCEFSSYVLKAVDQWDFFQSQLLWLKISERTLFILWTDMLPHLATFSWGTLRP